MLLPLLGQRRIADRLARGQSRRPVESAARGRDDRSGGDDRQRFPSPHSGRGSSSDVVPIDLPSREPLQDFVQSDATFHPRQRSAQTEVNAVAECEVLTDVAMDVEPIGILVFVAVAVGGPREADHGAPGRHRVVVQLDVVCDVPGDVRRRRLEAQEFLDGICDE